MLLRTLSRHEREAYAALLLSLEPRDRMLRFFTPLSDRAIRAHIDCFDWTHGRIIGVHDRRLDLVGAAEFLPHPDGRVAEAAFEVLPRARSQGLGRALMNEVIDLARCSGIETLHIEFLAENEPMRRLVAGAGMTIASIGRGEREGLLPLAPAHVVECLLRSGAESEAQWRYVQASAARATARIASAWVGAEPADTRRVESVDLGRRAA